MQVTIMLLAGTAFIIAIVSLMYEATQFIIRADLALPPHRTVDFHKEALSKYQLAAELHRRKEYIKAIEFLRAGETLLEGTDGNAALESHFLLLQTMCQFSAGLASGEECLEKLDIVIFKLKMSGLVTVDAEAAKANLLVNLERFEEAARLLHKCIDEVVTNSERAGHLLAHLGVVYWRMSRIEDSRSYLKEAREILSDYPNGERDWHLITVALKMEGDIENL